MKPIIALVGRPNVGKSTLFNYLTSSKDALIADRPGVTRDCQSKNIFYNNKHIVITDTGGIGEQEHDSKEIANLMTDKTIQAAKTATALIFIVDGRSGLSNIDVNLAKKLRKLGKPIFVAVNKLEGYVSEQKIVEFYELGLEHIFAISAKRGDGIEPLMNLITSLFQDNENYDKQDSNVTIAILGKPNAGKSTLINRMIGEEKMITYDHPGTTRDSIQITFERLGKSYNLIDTAGVRKKSKIVDSVEKISVIKSLDTIKKSNIIILVIDAKEGLSGQDSSLLGLIEDNNRAVIVAINKWDGLNNYEKERIKYDLERQFRFADYVIYHYISALHGTGVGNIFKSIDKIYKSQNIEMSTSDMTKLLESAILKHPPQMIAGQRIKLRFAHIGGYNPIRVIIHGNKIKYIPDSYTKYLASFFRKSLNLLGTPVMIVYKQGDNPFKDVKNKLTTRQINKKKRLMNFVKRKK